MRNVRVMNPSLFFIILLHFSLTTAVNFTQVFEWPDGMDYEWPSEESRTKALEDGIFNPEKIAPRYMAVYRTRIFLSLEQYENIPVTLVSLPTSNASSASPKLTPFPSWREMHGKGDCDKIEEARGLQVDSVGRLWVLDSGSDKCNSKLWTIDLSNNHTVLEHRFSFRDYIMHDLGLDETPNGTVALISFYGADKYSIAFSLERNRSRILSLEYRFFSFALFPKGESRKLYVSHWETKVMFSFHPIAEFGNATYIFYHPFIGKWSAIPYRMLIDSHGTMYAAFKWKNYIRSWNTSQLFEEQPFYEVENLGTCFPFTFALDSSGTFWMTELNNTASKPTYRLLKAATTEVQESNLLTENRIIIIILICGIVLFSLIILWIVLTLKRKQNTTEDQEMSVLCYNNDDISPAEVLNEDEVTQPRPFHLVSTISPRSE